MNMGGVSGDGLALHDIHRRGSMGGGGIGMIQRCIPSRCFLLCMASSVWTCQKSENGDYGSSHGGCFLSGVKTCDLAFWLDHISTMFTHRFLVTGVPSKISFGAHSPVVCWTSQNWCASADQRFLLEGVILNRCAFCRLIYRLTSDWFTIIWFLVWFWICFLFSKWVA